jgi:hypothetical protein
MGSLVRAPAAGLPHAIDAVDNGVIEFVLARVPVGRAIAQESLQILVASGQGASPMASAVICQPKFLLGRVTGASRLPAPVNLNGG